MNLIKLAAVAVALVASSALLPARAEARPGRHGGHPHHAPPSAGHYETRVVQRWVEGRYEQRWIEGACYRRGGGRHHRHHGRMYCEPGRYESVWVPGHYATVSERVWVPHRRWARSR